ncbi:hypothetical protein MmTuc01_1694 [Methanosarcina mazei Tuc01]|uniref:Uncharacterized protein n=1 Tax=Methanosarcina mazei Tuc01 TaxID=1236903 RepID=M1QA26_METMZ|nr:hypothetical protein MmTuc01_1694 [Methanosarcina mazei Tuc01]
MPIKKILLIGDVNSILQILKKLLKTSPVKERLSVNRDIEVLNSRVASLISFFISFIPFLCGVDLVLFVGC